MRNIWDNSGCGLRRINAGAPDGFRHRCSAQRRAPNVVESAAESLGEDGLGEFVDVPLCLLVAIFNPICDRKEGFDTADDLVLLCHCW